MGCLRGFVVLIALVVIVAAVGSAMKLAPTEPTQAVSRPVAVATIDKSPKMQADRKALIDKLIRQGVFYKIEVPGTLPRLWVKPAFYLAEFDQKQSFVSVVYAYYFDGSDQTDSVRIFDSRSGKEVGSYSAVQGGLKLN